MVGPGARPLGVHRAAREGVWEPLWRSPAAPRPPAPAPAGSRGGDELRRLQLQLPPLLSLGEGPRQGRAIVLPGSGGAPGPRCRPSWGHGAARCVGKAPGGHGERGPPCHGWASCSTRGCVGDKASPQSHLLGERGLAASPVGLQGGLGDIAATGRLLQHPWGPSGDRPCAPRAGLQPPAPGCRPPARPWLLPRGSLPAR